jgi:hypothetical protein
LRQTTLHSALSLKQSSFSVCLSLTLFRILCGFDLERSFHFPFYCNKKHAISKTFHPLYLVLTISWSFVSITRSRVCFSFALHSWLSCDVHITNSEWLFLSLTQTQLTNSFTFPLSISWMERNKQNRKTGSSTTTRKFTSHWHTPRNPTTKPFLTNNKNSLLIFEIFEKDTEFEEECEKVTSRENYPFSFCSWIRK